MTYDRPLHVPAALVNVARLREEALELLGSTDNTPITLRERVVVAILINRELSNPHHPLMDTVREELQTWALPRYTWLVGALAPYSLVSSYPSAMVRLARYLLGHTRAEEEATIDWSAVRYHHPQL